MLRKLNKMRKKNKNDSTRNMKIPVLSDPKTETKLAKELRLETEETEETVKNMFEKFSMNKSNVDSMVVYGKVYRKEDYI